MRKICWIGVLLLASPWVLADLKVEPAPVQEPGYSLPPVKTDGGKMPVRSVLERVRFVGNRAISSEDLQGVVAPYLGRMVAADDLEALRQKVTLCYVERGYINSGAVLADPALDHGTWTLQIVEGRLKEMHLHGLGGLDERYVRDRLVQDPLNIQTLSERMQLLLTDPLFTRMYGRVLPTGEPGEAILEVDIERARPYQLSMSADNYRPVAIGEDSATLGGRVRNLTGEGDLFEASYQSPLNEGDATRTTLGWTMPFNTRGTALSLDYDEGASSVIEQPIQPLDIRSDLVGKDIGLSQTLAETLTYKFSIGLHRVFRQNSTTLLGLPYSFVPGEATGTSRARDWRFWQEYTQRRERQALSLRSTFTLGDNNQLDVGSPPAAPPQHYHSWLGQAQYAQRLFDHGAQFLLRLNIQASADRLIPLEGISVGGVNSVRGFRENQLVRDNAQVMNVELDFPVLTDGATHLDLVPFYDFGRAWDQDADKVVISSAGLATRLHWKRLSLDLTVARRLAHPAGIVSSGSGLQDQGIELRVAYGFFGEGK